MNQQCRFCSRNLKSLQEVVDHYRENHVIRSDNSPTFDSYVVAISRDSNHSTQMFNEFCEFSKSPPFFDLKKKAEHYKSI